MSRARGVRTAAGGRLTGARRAGPAETARAAPHATAHRRCSAAGRHAGARPAPQVRVCRMVSGRGNPDPSRDDGRDRPAGGRDDPAVLQDSVDGVVGPRARSRGARPSGTRANSRRVRDRRRGKSQRAGHTPGTSAREALTPRGRSAERAPSTISGDMGEWKRLIRPAAASSRSRGPGGSAPGPHASLCRVTPYCNRAPPRLSAPRRRNQQLVTRMQSATDQPRWGIGERQDEKNASVVILIDPDRHQTDDAGGPFLMSNSGSILASAEAGGTQNIKLQESPRPANRLPTWLRFPEGRSARAEAPAPRQR